MTQTAYSPELLASAEAGDVNAQYQMGLFYATGQGVDQDAESAVNWFSKAGEQGHPEALCNLGFMYAQGSVDGKADMNKAVEYFEKSAAKDFHQAHFNLAIIFMSGQGVPANEQKALEHYQKAADLGNTSALYNVGLFYYTGHPLIEQNFEKAIEYFRKGADQSHPESQYSLGLCYSMGNGVEVDRKEAVYWYTIASNQGHSSAQFNLGLHYYYGEGGLDKNLDLARGQFEKAAKQGHPEAPKALAALDAEQPADE